PRDCAFLRPRTLEDGEAGMDHRFDCRFSALAGEGSFKVSARSRKTFQQLVTLPDAAIPLAEAALIMACEEYPQLELSPYLDLLDHMADAAQQQLNGSEAPAAIIAKINHVLFDTYGFRGNTGDYYDPR